MIEAEATRWTQDEDKFLRTNYASMTVGEICEFLGRSRRSVLGRINRIRLLKYRKWMANELGYLLEHRGAMTHAEMAAMLGRTTKGVSRAIERYGMQQHHVGFTEHDQRRFKNLHTRGYSDLKIARKLRLTKSRVLRYRLRIGLPGNGYTDKSWTAPDPAIRDNELRRAAVSKFGTRLVAKDELVQLALQFIDGNDELLAVSWEGMSQCWTPRSTIACMAVAHHKAILRFRRETYSHLSLDGIAGEDERRFEPSHDNRLSAIT